MREPSPRAMNSGFPPTLRNARTGELTPPGINCCARSKIASDFSRCILSSLVGHQAAQAETHRDVVKTAVKIPHQPVLQPEIGLLAREQVLHDPRKPRAVARELDHPRGHTPEEEATKKY